jgi:tripartite-type tricarboxylate transporter receptor subunit TctC
MKRILFTAMAALAASTAFAEYPDKPVTIVVPFSAGGPTDKVARDLAEAMRKTLNATLIVENVGGAGGTLGATKVAKAAPDGYTLLLAHAGISTAPALYRNLQYKTLEDFEYLGMINEVPMTLVGKPTLPANTYPELLKWLEANKGKVNLANAGLGSASHLCGLMFQSTTKIEMQTVPYKGTGPAMTDLIGGQVDLMCDQTTNTTGQIESGKIKAGAGQAAHAGRGRPEGLQRHHLARDVRAEGHAQARAGEGEQCPEGRAEGCRLHQARGSAGRGGGHRCARQPGGTQEVRRVRDQQVGSRDQGCGTVRGLIASQAHR